MIPDISNGIWGPILICLLLAVPFGILYLCYLFSEWRDRRRDPSTMGHVEYEVRMKKAGGSDEHRPRN